MQSGVTAFCAQFKTHQSDNNIEKEAISFMNKLSQEHAKLIHESRPCTEVAASDILSITTKQ